MKKSFIPLLLIVVLLPLCITAQILHPVKWVWKAEPAGKDEYKLVFTAAIEPGWHIYSLQPAADGFVRTGITFSPNQATVLIGKTTERGDKVHEAFDENMGFAMKQFEGTMVCEQLVKVKADTKLKGMLECMACKESCIPAELIEFEFDLKANSVAGAPAVDNNTLVATPALPDKAVAYNLPGAKVDNGDSIRTSVAVPVMPTPGDRFGKAQANCGTVSETGEQSIWAIVVLGFLGGLLALITPCVFPMIPLTVSFFTKRSENKTRGKYEALFYGFSIVLIYFLIAVPFLLFDISPDTLNAIATGVWLNVFFFVVFVMFAFSFFGFYEIQLPGFIANKADNVSNVGGLIGIFFMALTLAIVSFSCTGPIIGSLLVGALSSASGKLNLVAGMTSFGLALALPFAVFALFPSLMKSLPKSGGWLNSVKVVLGFVELIFAIKFLSNADMVDHWGLLKRETFLALWAMLGAGLFVYLIGLFKFPHDSAGPKKLTPVRVTAAMAALIFTLYAGYGIFGNDLKFFSGFPPPKFYSYLKGKAAIEPIKNDYAAALAKAKAEGKPLMIDFTGWACVSCRRMEETVWPEYDVLSRLSEKYVIVSLYVDDRQPLPESEQYVSKVTGKKIKTLGNKFSDMQASYFHSNTQPYYVLVSPDEKLLTKPCGYTPNKEEYISFLDCGLNAYKHASL
ncbi:MAG TPA: cytochrome c biogenesis protein CcdA [Chitinophagales bacterium]|nr:cytochrome c biogenesis protein CcdA [Chitinophagales bacterium]